MIDANIGLQFPMHQKKKGGKRYSIEPKPYAVIALNDF